MPRMGSRICGRVVAVSAATDVYTDTSLDATDAWLLEHDPEQVEPLQLVGPTADEVQDAEDAALIAASTSIMGLGRLSSAKISSLTKFGDLSWHDLAECRDAPAEDADLFTEARSQAEGARVISDYCSGCPVVRDCLDEGRRTRAWGVNGGFVLVDGRKAAQDRPDPASSAAGFRSGSAAGRGSGSEADRAAVWLAGWLGQNGPTARQDVLAAGLTAGHTMNPVDRAAGLVGVTRSRTPGCVGVTWGLADPVQASVAAAQEADEAAQISALWLIDYIDAHGPTPRADVLAAAPHSEAATLAGAALLDLDTDAERWALQ